MTEQELKNSGEVILNGEPQTSEQVKTEFVETSVPIRIQEQLPENVFAGLVGAFLFSLIGGILWFVVYQIGFIAGICGLVTVICAIQGYRIFTKNISKKGLIISLIIAVLVIILAEYFCLSYDVFNAHKQWFENGEIDYTLSFFESVRYAYLWLEETEVLISVIKDIAIGIVLGIVASFSYIKKLFKEV